MEYLHGGDVYTYKNMLDFSANINPLGPSETVLEAARESLKKINQYPDSKCRKLREALSEKMNLPMEYFIAGNGAADLFYSLVLAEKPRHALLPVPAFSEYEQALKTTGCKIEYFMLKREENFCITEDILPCITPDIDMIFLCSPSNPAGQIIDGNVLQRIISRCSQYQVRIVIDECFCDFVEDRSCNLEEIISDYSCIFLVRAFTKMHALAGLRIGYGISSDTDLLKQMNRVRQPWSVSIPAQAAGRAALKETERESETRIFIRRERIWLEKKLEETGFSVIPSSANFILFSGKKGLSEKTREYGILIRDCANYRGLEAGWYRIAVRLHEENKRLIRVLKRIVREETV